MVLWRSVIFFMAAFVAVCAIGASTAVADIIGPTDDRVEIDPMERPYVAALGYEWDGDWIIFGNAWQTGHPRVLVTAAHLFAHNGEWNTNQSVVRPSAEDLRPYEVLIAGCPGEGPYWVQEVLEVGSLWAGPSAQDWVVLLLDRPTCLGEDDLARTLNISDGWRKQALFGENAVLEGRLDSFFDRDRIGNEIVGKRKKGIEWPLRRNGLFSSFGPIRGHRYYKFINGQILGAWESEWGRPNVLRDFLFYGDADQGNSGAPVSAIGSVKNGDKWIHVDHVIGMQVAENSLPEEEENILAIFEGEFQAAVERAIAVAEERDR